MSKQKSKSQGDLVPNKPESLPGRGLSGPRKTVSRSEAKQRALAMDRLLTSGKSDLEIEEVMAKLYEMDADSTHRLMGKRLQVINQEDVARHPFKRAMTARRLHTHIDGAKEDRRWGDIANLEKVLAGVEGTLVDPKEQTSPTDQRITEATLRILNESDPKEVRAIIERERVLILKGGDINTDINMDVIDVTEESKCARLPK